MSIQARMSANDQRLYNPNRDVAHNFSGVVERLIDNYDNRGWAELRDFTDANGITDEDIANTLNSFVTAILYSKDKDKKNLSVHAALKDSGFFEQKLLAQVTIMSLLGQIYTGMHYVGIREASLGSEGPMYELDSLLDAAMTLREKMSKKDDSKPLAQPFYVSIWTRISNYISRFRH